MARLTGFTLGELRGKMGGIVFSRNKAGAYIRALVTPVNPQTVRQQTARYRFGNASILFQNLSANVKDCWETFARTHFNPLKGNSTGIYSGGNAFVALFQSVGQGNQYESSISAVSGIAPVTVAINQYPLLTDSPSTPTSSTIKASDGNAYPLEISGISVFSNGSYSYALRMDQVPIVDPPTFEAFINAEDQPFGVGLYMSNNLKFEGAKPNTALKLNFADSQVITAINITAGLAPIPGQQSVDIVGTNNIVLADIRDFPCVDDWILVTPFVRSYQGAQKLMTPQYVQVQEAP